MSDNIVIIKKYANRRLYNTETSTYITLEDLSDMVKEGRNFEVVDARTGADITHQVLAQIIFEEETRGAAMLPISFLKQLIRFYDNSMNTLLPQFLEMSMDIYNRNATHWRERQNAFGAITNPLQAMGDLQKQNMEMLRRSMALFNPFLQQGTPAGTSHDDPNIKALMEKINELNAEIDRLKKQ